MQNTLELNLLPSASEGKTLYSSKAHGAGENSLFHEFLAGVNNDGRNPGGFGLSLFQNSGKTEAESFQIGSGSKKINLKKLNKKLQDLGKTSSNVLLSESAIPQLTAFLEGKGFSKDKITELIKSSTNSDGLIRLDKLLNQLVGDLQSKGLGKNNLLVEARDVPKMEELFYRLGLRSEEIKEIVEKASTGKGDLLLSNVTDALQKHTSFNITESEIKKLLEQAGISSRPQFSDNKNLAAEIQKEYLELTKASSDSKQSIKQDIAVLLREKGIPPEEVKKFLETLDIKQPETGFKNSTIDGKSTGSDNLLNHVVIKNKQQWTDGGLQEKILGILKKENIFQDINPNKNWFQDQGDLKLNITDLIKNTDQKIKADSMTRIVNTKGDPLTEGIVQKAKGDGSEKKGDAVREGLGTDFNIQRQVKEAARIQSGTRPGNMVNLPEPLPRIVDRMAWMVRGGEQRSRIVLNPPELGRIDVELSLKQGHLHANLGAESTAIKELVEANLNQLRQQLSDQGIVIDKFEVMVGLGQREFSEKEMWSNNRQKSSNGKAGMKGSMQPADEKTMNRRNINPTQIDVHV